MLEFGRYLCFTCAILCVSGDTVSVSPEDEYKKRTTEEAVFTATLDFDPDPADVAWSVLGTLLIRSGMFYDQTKYDFTYNRATRTSVLRVKDLQLSDDGNYICSVYSNPIVTSRATKLTVLVPPSSIGIIGRESVTALEGSSYNISCTAEGSNPPVTLVWTKDGAAVTEGVTQTSSKPSSSENLYITSGVVSIKPTKADNGAAYVCAAAGDMMLSQMSASTTLNVEYKPGVSMTPSGDEVSVNEGETITFSCSADANPAANSWQWMMDDELLAGETSATITFTAVTRDMNAKSIKCVASNSAGSGSAVHKLNVYYAPQFTVTADNVQVDLGDTVSLVCEVDGNPSPSIVWMRKGSSRILTSNSELKISSVTEGDIGAYECIGTVTNFQNAVHTTHILKKDVPMIKETEDFSYSQGETAVLTCEAECVPAPTSVTWRRSSDNTIINSAGRFTVSRAGTISTVVSTLSISDLVSDDFANYNCTFVNERGRDSRIITLSQTEAFPWVYIVIAASVVVVVTIVITITVCCCRRSKEKSSSAGSLSVVSNTTENSLKKPTDFEHMDSSSLPEYDRWVMSTQGQTHIGYDSLDYPKPELYGTSSASPVTFGYNVNPPGNYGSYRVTHPRDTNSLSLHMHQYSTLPLRPSMLPYNTPLHGYGSSDGFPEPPSMESRLATNV